MKKLCVVLTISVLLAGFCACEKDNLGVYNPKLKISKIYSEEEGHYLQEQWIWSGDQLSKIDFYRKTGDVKNTHRYFYSDNRLVRIENGDDEYSEFEYDGKLLTTIKTYSGEKLVETYELTYDNKKLSHISIQKPSKNFSGSNFLPYFLPDGGRVLGDGGKAESYNFSSAEVDFHWDGDNVINMKMKLARPDSIQKLTVSYVYDDNINPMNRFLAIYLDHQLQNDRPQYNLCSQNNALSVSVTDEYDVFSRTKSYTYSYDYYKKYPTKVYSTSPSTNHFGDDSTLIYTYIYQ